jgi:hypothetical protein
MLRRSLLAALSLPLLPAALAADQSAHETIDPADLLGPRMPYTSFDRLPATDLQVGATTIHLAIVPNDAHPGRQAITEWTRRSAGAIARYYGRLPTASVRILVLGMPGDGVHGTTWGYRGPATRIRLGQDVPAAALDDDWVLVHEMVHMSTPGLPEDNLWLTEGLATYIEPIARAQAGIKPIESVWAEMAAGMPKGEPAQGDQGLDHTHTWGRTYWGGALFCLQADVEIRSRTDNRRGLQDGLRAIVAAGGSNAEDWPLERFLAAVDQATGVAAMVPLYARHRDAAIEVDLDDLWHRLGVRARGGSVVFDDAAPLAGVRRAISAGS